MNCCCVRVSLNLLVNLLQRTSDGIMEMIYCQRSCCSSSSLISVAGEDQYQCHQQPPQQPPKINSDHQPQQLVQCVEDTTDEKGSDLGATVKGSSFYNVLYDTVELEPYYCTVDRRQSEEILRGLPDGSCIVRPFKFKHPHIRYILSVRTSGAYFHLFIRQTRPNGMYALGLEKPKERQFKFPSDIVQYYRTHRLECTSSGGDNVKIRFHLLPIVNICANHPRRCDDDDAGKGCCDISKRNPVEVS